MPWTYSNDPTSSAKDAVRFLIGDTDSTDPLSLSDQEINFLLSEWENNPYFAAAAGAEQLAGQFAKQVNYASDDVQFAGDDLQQKYMTLAAQLRTLGKRKGRSAVPFDGSNDWCDWSEYVDKIKVGMNDNRRDGANAPIGQWPNPLLDQSDSGLAEG